MHTTFQNSGKKVLSLLGMAATLLVGFSATEAKAIPLGWNCVGSCGTSGANGVVMAPPNGSTYDWISTAGAPLSNGLGLGEEYNGSLLTSSEFGAKIGDKLAFYFNYVTTDGSGYTDYAWARLVNMGNNAITYLLTARTQPSGDIIPGAGLPPVAATLDPVSVPIIPNATTWSPLGVSSGSCYGPGCGSTGWVSSSFAITEAGNYRLEFGIANWSDDFRDSGLALSGAVLNDTPINDVPEPASAFLVAAGLLGMARLKRRSRQA